MTKEIKEVMDELAADTTPPSSKEKRSWRNPNLSLAAFLAISILAAGIVVGVGHTLYVTSTEYKLDITRPGLNDIKTEELVEVDRTQRYDSSSPVTGSALEDEQKRIEARLQELKRYGDFDDTELTTLQDSLFTGSVKVNQ